MGQIMNNGNAKENGDPLSTGPVNRDDAVANALPELKEHATGIIGCNEEDAVAFYLKGIINNGN